MATGRRDNCTTGCLPDYNYFKEHYKVIAKVNNKHLMLANPKSMQQINITGNLDPTEIPKMFFFIE